jgi:beta-lactamase class A
MNRLISAIGCIVFCLSAMPLQAAEDPGLTKLLAAEAAQFPGKMTIYVKQLKTGQEASVAPDEPMDSMSVIKLGILVKAFQMAEQNSLDLDARTTLKSTDLRGGSGVLQYHTPGLNPTVRDLLWEMVITSDNTATEAMLARVGGVEALNHWYAKNGFEAMQMRGTVNAYFAKQARLISPRAQGLSDEEINASGVEHRSNELSPAGKALAAELAAPQTWLNSCSRFKQAPAWFGSISARAVGRLLEQMQTGKLVSKAHSAEMMDMLENQQAGARRIPMYLDTQYMIAHKTGDFPPCVANDVGVVYLKSGATIMVFLTDQIRGNYGEAEERIGGIARQIAEYFDGN